MALRPPPAVSALDRRMSALSLAYLNNNPETAESLVFGFGLPPAPVLAELRSRWWRLRAQGVRLPAERRIIVHHRVWP